MPNIFLSPSLQPANLYVSGGNEAQYMGYLADALEPYLTINGINYTRSRYPNTLLNAINTSNQGNYDLHLALHSNASPVGKEGLFRGIQAYYYPTSVKGKAAAQDLVDSLKTIYPDPDLVYTVPSTVITEVRRTKAPAVLMEIGYHDNSEDAKWIKENIQNIAESLARGLCNYFKIPFKDLCQRVGGPIVNVQNVLLNTYVRVCTKDGDNLNIRQNSNTGSAVIGQIPAGEKAIILEKLPNGWARVRYNSVEGFASGNFLCVCQENTAQKGRVNTGGSNLNLRKEPSLNSAVITRIPDNSTVNILGSSGNWYNVNYMGQVGYVLKEFISL